MDIAIVSNKAMIIGLKIMKPNYHLNYGKRRIDISIKNNNKFIELEKCVKKIFKGGFDKSYFIENPEKAYHYISAQHMTKRFPKEESKLISKTLTKNFPEMMLKQGQILVSCAGTVGNTRYVDQNLEGILGSQDIIRIDPNDELMLHGYLYAYLSSKTCFQYLQSYVYGSVVPRIDPKALKNLPIPVLSNKLQIEINSKILKASSLRSMASKSLESAINEVEIRLDYLDKKVNDFNKFGKKINILNIKKLELRLDSPYNNSKGRIYQNNITQEEHFAINEIAEVFHPMLFGKKQLKGTESRGNQLFKSSSMMKLVPETDFLLSLKKTDKYEKLQVDKNWILISRTGTVGNVVLIYDNQKGIFIDDHMIRIKPKNDFAAIIYFFIKSKFGQELIKFQKYGSVQEVINSNYIERIPIPKSLFEFNFNKKLTLIFNEANDQISKASVLEKEAIDLVEKEIELWQK